MASKVKGGSSIRINPANKGKLHQMLGISPDQPIPVRDLENAAHSTNPLERKRAQFALNARKFNH